MQYNIPKAQPAAGMQQQQKPAQQPVQQPQSKEVAPKTEEVPASAPVGFDYANLAHLLPMAGARSVVSMSEWLTMIIYGDYGTGKTHLSGTAALVPEMTDILYISLEGGESVLREIARQCIAKGIDPNVITVLPVQDFKQFAQAYEVVRQHIDARDSNNIEKLRMIECQIRGIEMLQKTGWTPKTQEPATIVQEISAEIARISKDKELMAELIPNPRKFKTVIIDSLTEAHKYSMYNLLGVKVATQKLDADIDKATFDEWGGAREQLQFLVRRFRDLAVHAILIMSQDASEDSKKHRYVTINIPGKLSNDLRGLVDTVGYLTKQPNSTGGFTRVLILEGGTYGGQNIAAKHRFGSALKGNFIEDPTMQKLYNLNQLSIK